MTRVYIVIASEPHPYGYDLMGVYATKEDAERAVEKDAKDAYPDTEYSILENTVGETSHGRLVAYSIVDSVKQPV